MKRRGKNLNWGIITHAEFPPTLISPSPSIIPYVYKSWSWS